MQLWEEEHGRDCGAVNSLGQIIFSYRSQRALHSCLSPEWLVLLTHLSEPRVADPAPKAQLPHGPLLRTRREGGHTVR